MKTIKIYSGKSIEDKCSQQLHPVNEVLRAKELVESEHDVIAYSNQPEFVMAIKYIGKKHGIDAEFFLDGVSHGNDTEPLFEDFNKSFDVICEFGLTD